MTSPKTHSLTILDKVQDFLQQDIPTDKKSLHSQLNTISKLRLSLVNYNAEAKVQFLKSQEKYRHPKDKNYTDWDRKIMLNDLIATEQKDYELSLSLLELLSDRRSDLIKLFS